MFQGHFTKLYYITVSLPEEMANSAVFNFRRNAGSDWISLTEVGREFQARDAAAGNARSPMVARRVGGTMSVDIRLGCAKVTVISELD